MKGEVRTSWSFLTLHSKERYSMYYLHSYRHKSKTTIVQKITYLYGINVAFSSGYNSQYSHNYKQRNFKNYFDSQKNCVTIFEMLFLMQQNIHLCIEKAISGIFIKVL